MDGTTHKRTIVRKGVTDVRERDRKKNVHGEDPKTPSEIVIVARKKK